MDQKRETTKAGGGRGTDESGRRGREQPTATGSRGDSGEGFPKPSEILRAMIQDEERESRRRGGRGGDE